MFLLCILEEGPFTVGPLQFAVTQKDNFCSVLLGQWGQTKIVNSLAMIPDLFWNCQHQIFFYFMAPAHSS